MGIETMTIIPPSYSFALGVSFLSIASATRRLWILPVAVFGITFVKNTYEN